MTAIDSTHDGALTHRANLNIASAVVARLGMGASDSLIGHVINDVRTRHSVAELANSGGMSGLLGAVDTAIARNTEASRPFNDTDSRAAQLAAQSGHLGASWHQDGMSSGRYGLLQAGRRAREAVSDSGEGSGTGRGDSLAVSGTGGEPAGAPFWGTAKGMLLTRSYANDNNMSWAPSDLMKMGRPALQALKESGLKGDGYKALRDPSGLHFSNETIVAGAKGYMKRNGCNDNDASKASAAVDRLAMPADMRERHRTAVEGIRTSTPENEPQRREQLQKSDDEIERHNPAYKAAVDQERRHYKQERRAAPKAEAAATQGRVAADVKDKAADVKDKAADVKDMKADAQEAAAEGAGQKANASKSSALAALKAAPKL